MNQAGAGRKWAGRGVDCDRDPAQVKDAALAALARTPGRPAKERDFQLEAARTEIVQLTEAVKSQAIELVVNRVGGEGKAGWGSARSPPQPPFREDRG